MKQIVNTMIASALLFFLSHAALASPVFNYTFNVTSYNCILPDCNDEAFYRRKLESMELDLTQQAIDNGKATLHYKTIDWSTGRPWHIMAHENQGFNSINLSAWNTALDLDQGLCKAYYLCNVEANLYASEFLTGNFRLDTDNDNLHMSSINQNTWSGYIYSDGPYMTHTPGGYPTFTGEWRLLRFIPEPGELILFLTAFTGMMVFIRRKLY